MKSFVTIAFVTILSSNALSQSLTDDPFVFATAGYELQEHSDLVTQSHLTSALAATSGTFSAETVSGHALARGFATYGQVKAYADVTMTKSGSTEFAGHSRGDGWFFDPLIFGGLVPEESYDVVVRLRISGDMSGKYFGFFAPHQRKRRAVRVGWRLFRAAASAALRLRRLPGDGWEQLLG